MTPFDALEQECSRLKADLTAAHVEIQTLGTRLGTAAHFAEFDSGGLPSAIRDAILARDARLRHVAPKKGCDKLAKHAENLLAALDMVDIRGATYDLPKEQSALLNEEILALRDAVREFRVVPVTEAATV